MKKLIAARRHVVVDARQLPAVQGGASPIRFEPEPNPWRADPEPSPWLVLADPPPQPW
jgi:hypothetical protein